MSRATKAQNNTAANRIAKAFGVERDSIYIHDDGEIACESIDYVGPYENPWSYVIEQFVTAPKGMYFEAMTHFSVKLYRL